jgi:hypothetical protein
LLVNFPGTQELDFLDIIGRRRKKNNPVKNGWLIDPGQLRIDQKKSNENTIMTSQKGHIGKGRELNFI